MKRLFLTDALRRVAANCVWFETPEEAAADSARFAAYVLTYGDALDAAVLRTQLDDDDIREALDNAPPGIFDPRSWAYWNLMIGREEAPPLPQRRLP
jgi:hypothetical protein